MAKTKEELIQLKNEYESLNHKLKELSEEELKEVIGGSSTSMYVTVPDIIGLKLGEAQSVLTQYNLEYDTKYEHNQAEKDTVLLTDPLPGFIVPVESKVVLTLSAGK